MDRLATEAGVSNPLIYKYFDTRLQLLQELLILQGVPAIIRAVGFASW